MLVTQRDAVAMAALAPLAGPFVPMTGHSMRPSGILRVLNEIVLNRRRRIVECGSGLSTMYMARVLKNLKDGGRIVSIDHDDAWLERIAALLIEEDLGPFVDFVHAPLVEGDWGMGPARWYDPDIVTSAVEAFRIDLLLVDGPVASDSNRQYDRYPAVPVLSRYFSEALTVILDDINRAGEKAVVDKWRSVFGVEFQCQPTAGRIAVGRRGPGFNV
jgi:hypothetical protein